MKIEWTDDECGAAEDARGVAISVSASDPCADRWRVAIEAVMTRAVELYLARALGQVKDAIRMVDDGELGKEQAEGLSVLSALAHEAGTLRTEVERLRAVVVGLEGDLATEIGAGAAKTEGAAERSRLLLDAKNRWAERARAAESRLAAILERAGNLVEGGHRLRMALLSEPNRAWSSRKYEDRASEFAKWVLEGDAPNSPGIPEGSSEWPKTCPLCSGTGWTNSVDQWPNPTKAERVRCWCQDEDDDPSDTAAANASTVSNGSGKRASYPQRHPHAYVNAHGQNDYCECLSSDGNHCGYPEMDHRWPCSATCTHEDAATPGHPERVKDGSEAMWRIVAPDAPVDVPDDNDAALTEEYAKGAEAMRAACLRDVVALLESTGLSDHGSDSIIQRVKAAIEGAIP
jgi:hypothetical protein